MTVATAPAEPLVPDLTELAVPVGGRVLVCSDLHLAREATTASTAAATELAQTLEAWTGPGVVILAGDCFELLEGNVTDPRPALQAHPRLTAALGDFGAGENRTVVCLPGNHDGRLAWDAKAVRALADELHARVAMTVELTIDTGAGVRRVHVEHGHQLDPANAFGDPRNPADSPLGHHLVREVLPGFRAGNRSSWLGGIEELADPAAFPRFVASRLAYRRVGRHAWWLLLPFVAALLLRVPMVYTLATRHESIEEWSRRGILIGLGAVLDVLLVAFVAALVARRTWQALSAGSLGGRGVNQNEAPRERARAYITAGGTGYISGHTHHPEMTHFGDGFYANTGCGGVVVDELPARFGSLGAPPVFLARREVTWVELEAGADLHARLLHARVDLSDGTFLERAIARRDKRADARPTVVASFPQGSSWPPVADPARHLRSVRRWAAGTLVLAGLLDLGSALYPPESHRLDAILRVVPLAVPRAATALVALAGLALLFLARGVRRGHRLAWIVAMVLLEGSAILHIAKGVDLEEAVVAIAVSLFLFANRRAFQARIDHPSLRFGLRALAIGLVAVTALGVAVLEAFTFMRHPRRLPLPTALHAVVERLVGIDTVPLSHRIDLFLRPTLLAIGIGLAGFAVWLALRPVVLRHRHGDTGLAQAREIVARYGRGTLDYFALRSDKQYFFDGESVVAYGVYGGVCLVSPDPIGPDAERDQVWNAFRTFADAHGWTLAVMGAGEDWLPVYRGSGMHDMYVGDEAVADASRFSLEGGRHKGLRQAVNRIAKYGYTISFHDPADLDPTVQEQLRDVMTKSRRGDVERGFSMTLGRIFDPDDKGLLLAVATGPDGNAVAFCQFVPAPGIDGYSLDLMRRDDGEHPNGLLDFVIVETIRELQRRGMRGLGLNFATMRAVLAGESGDSLTQRVERWLFKRMSDSMQIESLWRFNAKFDPDWQPRYAVYDSPEHMLPAAIAVARAESWWEIPIIGRFFRPDRADSDVAEGSTGDAETAEPAAEVAPRS